MLGADTVRRLAVTSPLKSQRPALAKRRLKRAGIRVKQWLCDEWGAYRCRLPARKLFIGKENTWQIERKNPDFHTRIKGLQRRTWCFSQKVVLHDTLIGLFINIVFFNCKLI